MSVQITAPELAGALDRMGIASPDMTSQELAECLLVEAITAQLQAERMAGADHSRGFDDGPAPYGRAADKPCPDCGGVGSPHVNACDPA